MHQVLRGAGLAVVVIVTASLLAFVAPAHATHNITSVSPSSLPQGASATVTITGTGFTPTATVEIDGGDITVGNPTVNTGGTQITVTVTVGLFATTSTRTLTVTNVDGVDEDTAPFTIVAKPRPSGLTPNGGIQGETGKRVTVAGSGFQPNATVAFSGTGITVVSKTVDSAEQITLSLDIAPDAPTGLRDITVTNPDGGTGTLSPAFSVAAPEETTEETGGTETTSPPPTPTVIDVSPHRVPRGAVSVLEITGTDFAEDTSVSVSGGGVFVVETFYGSSSLLFAVVIVDDEATPGPRDMTTLNGAGTEQDTCAGCLAVVPQGYHLVASDGGIFGFGSAPFHGSLAGTALNAPVVGMSEHPSGDGYWLVAADGAVFAFGAAPFHGSMGGVRLNQPIVGMASTPTGEGYWLVASDGGIFAFGDAEFAGSTGAITLNQPIVGMASTATGAGYWLVASDGGIFAFGDAAFLGSTGDIELNSPVVGMAPAVFGEGYWLVAADGGIFAFGDAEFLGSMGGQPLNQPIVGMATSPDGAGYRMVASDGGAFSFGNAHFEGSMGGTPLNRPIVAIGAL